MPENRNTLLAKANNLPPIDENVKLPAAAQAAVDAANAAIAAQNEPSPQPADEPLVEIIPPQPDLSNSDTPIAEPTPPQATQPGNEPPNEPNYEHMYKSQLGRVREQNRTIEQLNDRILSMGASLETLQSELQRQRQEAPRPEPVTLDTKTLFTEQDRADYGDDMLTTIATAAQKIANQLVDQRTQDLEQRLNLTSAATQATARDRCNALLDDRCPEWREINMDEEFKSWLALPDEYSGAIRHTLLNEAYGRNDGPRTLAFFKGFLSEKAATAPATTASLPEAPTGAQPAKPGLEQFAAPGRARTAATPTSPAEKPILTHSEIAGFYDEVRRGVYRGREDEQTRREAMIFEAQRDGRVRTG